MAHLIKCWCGKEYRCERQHKPSKKYRYFIITDKHDKCPDSLIHGPMLPALYTPIPLKLAKKLYG